ncbi:hypothetical protein [Burkholderia cepacia]|uniref:hypothetical protein n=1 Tax=Burkholderia cepacia TaxID=292 RepID=UPI00384E020F
MTLGELARLFNACLHIGAAVTVVPMANYARAMRSTTPQCRAPTDRCDSPRRRAMANFAKTCCFVAFHADVISRRDSAKSRASPGDLPAGRGARQPTRTLRTGGA